MSLISSAQTTMSLILSRHFAFKTNTHMLVTSSTSRFAVGLRVNTGIITNSMGKPAFGAVQQGGRRGKADVPSSSRLTKDLQDVYNLRFEDFGKRIEDGGKFIEGFGKRIEDMSSRLLQKERSFLTAVGFVVGFFYFTNQNVDSKYEKTNSKFETTNTKIDSLKTDMDSKIDFKIDSLKTDMDSKIDSLKTDMDSKFENLDRKMDKMYDAFVGANKPDDE